MRSKQDRESKPTPQLELFGGAPPAGRGEQPSVSGKLAKPAGKLVLKPTPSQPVAQPVKAEQARPVHLLDVRAAAAWLGLSKSTLDKMRYYGEGPRYIRATSRAVRYDPDDLAEFAEARRQIPSGG